MVLSLKDNSTPTSVQFIPVKTPQIVKRMFPQLVWNIKTTKKEIYLTFDDGPTPNITQWVLDELRRYNAKATFFCIGSNIEKHPNIFKAILNEGHAIGNHTYNHLKGFKADTATYIEDVNKAQDLINVYSKINNQKSTIRTIFRPPYGKITPKQVKALLDLNYKIVMWDVLSFDWDTNTSKKECLNHIISKAVLGSIVVCHDSHKASENLKYVLPKVLDYFSNKGYTFKALD